mgnify:CR=1 FL=1
MNSAADLSPEQRHAALFAQMVMQFTSTGLVFLGRAPNPVTGKTETDLDMAQMVVDQLEMLEARTRGNLSADEQKLLRQSLTTLRMAFVEAVNQPPAKPGEAPAPETPASSDSPAGGEESRKKFSKRYGQG